MSKKVLAISSSPRKGRNSDILCDRLVQGALENGNDVEKVFISDLIIHYCTGCGHCFTCGACSQEDDMKQMLPKLVEADVIIFATPVYFYSMCGQMKTFIDRTTPVYQRMKGKTFFYIVTASDDSRENMNRTLEGFRAFAQDCLDDAVEGGVVYGVGASKDCDITKHPAYDEAYKIGKTI